MEKDFVDQANPQGLETIPKNMEERVADKTNP